MAAPVRNELWLGHRRDRDAPVTLTQAVLSRHVMALGSSGSGNVYLHPRTLAVLVYGAADGIAFVAEPTEYASAVNDFDDVVRINEVSACEPRRRRRRMEPAPATGRGSRPLQKAIQRPAPAGATRLRTPVAPGSRPRNRQRTPGPHHRHRARPRSRLAALRQFPGRTYTRKPHTVRIVAARSCLAVSRSTGPWPLIRWTNSRCIRRW